MEDKHLNMTGLVQ